MQAAEKSDNLGESLIHLLVGNALNSLPQFLICEVSNEGRRVLIDIHEILERGVTTFLKLDIEVERVSN